ncbi:Tll0287-like domain-containing protein [Leptospira harrisiae]|uniref:Tll0287-like domain-containing protein n=1 Tax=Leptospira harrisiae TaxID=2023189 RepID=A0A2N0ANE4_9LEPT|nr:DUF3365 domain-containing protein [Leptospira harrisiae]PJZ85803.1 hypothetical protein CH364_06305 [Leptospira harrisiae]PKA09367.1 hypothetical protein CH366_06590 [Leptospira harrisiae]
MVTKKSFVFKLSFWILILVFGSSCQTQNPDYEKIALKITNEAKTNLVQKLSALIAEGGTKKAIPFCKINALGITDQLGKKHRVELRRITNKPRNLSNFLSEEEKRIFLEIEKLKTSDGVFPNQTFTSDDSVTVYIPIPVAGLCIQCHGEPNKDIKNETLVVLDKEYPSDKAKGYRVGDLRGLFSVKFPK